MKKTLKWLITALLCVGCIGFATMAASCNQKQSYAVIYNVDKGKPVRQGTYTVGENFTLPTPTANASWYGWYFTGWYYDAACTKKVSRRDIDLSYVTDSKLTLYAGWSDIRTIYFDSKTTQILPEVEYHIGDTVKLADLPTPDAYVVGGQTCDFVCWVGANDNQPITGDFTMQTENMYLYARYNTGVNDQYDLKEVGYVPMNNSANTQVFDYTLNDGEIYSVDIVLPERPTTFNGDSGMILGAESFNPVSKQFNNYILMFVCAYENGFGSLVFYATQLTENTVVEKDALGNVVDEKTDSSTSFSLVKRVPLDSADLFGTAYYKKMMQYKENGGECTLTYTMRRRGDKTWYIGVDGTEYFSVTLEDSQTESTADNGENKVYTTTKKTWLVGENSKLVGLRAKTRNMAYKNLQVTDAELTLNFSAGVGSVDTAQKACSYNTPIGQLPVPTRSGYQFKYWYYVKNGEHVVIDENTVFDTEAWQIHAKACWEKDVPEYFNVAFNTGVQGYTVDSLTAWEAGNELETPTLARPFYTFSGNWYYDENCTQLVDLIDVDTSKAVDGTITLYAGCTYKDELFTSADWCYSNGVYTGTGTTLIDTQKLTSVGGLMRSGYTYSIDVILPCYNMSSYGNAYIYFGATGLDASSKYFKLVILGNAAANVDTHGAIQLWEQNGKTALVSRNRATEQLIATGFSEKYADYMLGNKTLKFTVGVVVKSSSCAVTIDGVELFSCNKKLLGEFFGFGSATSFAVNFCNITETKTVQVGYTGEGTQANPYKIKSVEDLTFFAERIGAGESYVGEYFALTNDIALDANTSWTPIAGSFAGILDGANYKITGLVIRSTLKNTGLFARLSGTVKRLTVYVDVESSAETVGGIAGITDGTCTIENCTVYGTIKGSWDVGGIVGSIAATQTTISGCNNYANIISTKSSGNSLIGGILGSSAASKKLSISNCKNYGSITANADFVGGVVGLLREDANSTVQNVYNYGNIIVAQNSKNVGGVIGCNRTSVTGAYCLSTATITLGTASQAANTYQAMGSETAYVGYAVGKNDTGGSLTQSGLCDENGTPVV